MDRLEVGMLVKSKAGHDKDSIYVIIEMDPSYVYLVDGSIRTLGKPKRKNRKHVQVICERHDLTGVDDVKIKRILKQYQGGNTCQKLM